MAILSITAVVVSGLVWSALVEAQPEPLRMVLSCQSAQSLTLRLENTGTEDSAVVVGMTLANGRRYIFNNLALRLKRAGSSAVESWRFYHYDPPMVISGRVDDWIVPLPVGGSFEMKLPVSQFRSERLEPLGGLPVKARASLRLPLRAPRPGPDLPALQFLRVWTGSGMLSSNEISIPEQCG